MLTCYIEYIFNDDIIPFRYSDIIDITFKKNSNDVILTYYTYGGVSTRVLKKDKIHKIFIYQN